MNNLVLARAGLPALAMHSGGRSTGFLECVDDLLVRELGKAEVMIAKRAEMFRLT
jgi:hypothetical protein